MKIFGKTTNKGGYAERMFGDFSESDFSSGYMNCLENGGAEASIVAETNGVTEAFVLATFTVERHHRRADDGSVEFPAMVDAARVGRIINSPLGRRLFEAFKTMTPSEYAELVAKTAAERFGQSPAAQEDFAAAEKIERELNRIFNEGNAAADRAGMAARRAAKAAGKTGSEANRAAAAARNAVKNEIKKQAAPLIYRLGCVCFSCLQTYMNWGRNEAEAWMDVYRRENGLPDPNRGYENPDLN